MNPSGSPRTRDRPPGFRALRPGRVSLAASGPTKLAGIPRSRAAPARLRAGHPAPPFKRPVRRCVFHRSIGPGRLWLRGRGFRGRPLRFDADRGCGSHLLFRRSLRAGCGRCAPHEAGAVLRGPCAHRATGLPGVAGALSGCGHMGRLSGDLCLTGEICAFRRVSPRCRGCGVLPRVRPVPPMTRARLSLQDNRRSSRLAVCPGRWMS